jgi:hypothetical protein
MATLQVNAADVVYGFRQRGLAVGKTENLTADTDPDHQLGKPGQYTGRTAFQDSSLTVQGDPFAVVNGGAVEAFASERDAQAARAALLTKASPAQSGEVDTVHGTVLLRLSTRLRPDQQSAYEAAVNDVLRLEFRRQSAAAAASKPGSTAPAPKGGK